jgi:hypothetical protein
MTFTPSSPYSYQIGERVGQDLSALNITSLSNFTTIGFSASSISVTGDAGGAVYLTFTPVPEPVSLTIVAGLGLAGFGAWRRKRAKNHMIAS